jgi:hypothetical protein
VEQNPEDEPASVLLKRIREQREAEGKVGRKNRQKQKKSQQLELF